MQFWFVGEAWYNSLSQYQKGVRDKKIGVTNRLNTFKILYIKQMLPESFSIFLLSHD